ncbi:thioredoxin family protein [Polluticoccus soli]|uniref:thioredoxin family protein n=1 Tax=Polluticoccus soli TaxID=3034150 RepID=UPI0023E2F046|nr:thioredoxin family protein [Flavipsychrobacter sp. JY13-12]
MKNFRRALLALAITTFVGSQAIAQEVKNGLTWYNDVQQAQAISEKTHKPIFGFFTGSDWCGWCKKLQAAVFAKPEFQTWAKNNVVLLELDFPRRTQLPEKIAQQNAELQNVFQVGGYPTVWIFNLDKDKKTQKFNISALGKLGYPSAQPGQEATVFLATANDILKNKNK